MFSTGVHSTTLAAEATIYLGQPVLHVGQVDSQTVITLEAIDGEIEFSDNSPRPDKVFDTENIHHLARWLSRSLPCLENQLPRVPIPGGCFPILHRRLLL